MKFTPIDEAKRLWAIRDIFPEDLVAELLALDWTNLPWHDSEGQEMWLRRSVITGFEPAIIRANQIIAQLHTQIEKECGVDFMYSTNQGSTVWWYDEPGFDVPLHTDGELPATMQIFWVAPSTKFGTCFYNTKRVADLKKEFDFVPNTGYIMLNGKNEDGSQPLQWHGMLNKVPPGTFRLTSYTTFGPYTGK